MAANLLGIKITTDKPTDGGECKINSIDELMKKFENLADKEALDEEARRRRGSEFNKLSRESAKARRHLFRGRPQNSVWFVPLSPPGERVRLRGE